MANNIRLEELCYTLYTPRAREACTPAVRLRARSKGLQRVSRRTCSVSTSLHFTVLISSAKVSLNELCCSDTYPPSLQMSAWFAEYSWPHVNVLEQSFKFRLYLRAIASENSSDNHTLLKVAVITKHLPLSQQLVRTSTLKFRSVFISVYTSFLRF